MNPGGLNRVPDSFAPAAKHDLMWHIQNPHYRPSQASPVDTQKPAEKEIRAIDEKTNKAVLILLKSCKFFFLFTFAPPYFLLVKLPMGLKRFSLPLIKKGYVALSKILQENYNKIKEVTSKLVAKVISPVVKGVQKASEWMGYIQTNVSEAGKKQFYLVKEKVSNALKPPLNAAIMLGNGVASLATWTGTIAHSLFTRAKVLPSALIQIPKAVSNQANHLKNGYVHAQEVLSYLMTKMKENVARAKKLIENAFEKTQRQLVKVKNWPMEQVKKIGRAIQSSTEQIAKVVTPIVTAVKESITHHVQGVIAFVQQPYVAALTFTSSVKGYMERAGQSLLRTFHEKASLVKISIIRTVQAFIAPFKRGFRYAKNTVKRLFQKVIKQPARYLIHKAQRFLEKAKNKFFEYLQKLTSFLRKIISLLKSWLQFVVYGLSLFWIWVKLISSFAFFLVRQAFREVLIWLQ